MRRMENELRRVAYFSMEVGLDSAVPTYSGGLGVLTLDLVGRVLQEPEPFSRFKDIMAPGRTLNLTFLALNLSGYVDGVAKKHGETSRLMFAGYRIEAITNGVHAATWTCESFQRLYDRHLPDWRQDNFSLRGALNLPTREVWEAHLVAKNKLLDEVRARTGDSMEIEPLTIGFARRATAYKRADLLFTDLDRLKAVSRKAGGLQLIFTGKAHPRDQGGKEVIHRILQARQSLQGEVEITYLENYDIELARLLVAGADVWLNTPEPPLEASGTSDMKAALNGVPSLSVLDGWWLEGHIEGVTGWSIGEAGAAHDSATHADALYSKLEQSGRVI